MSDVCNRVMFYVVNIFIILVKDGEWYLKGVFLFVNYLRVFLSLFYI